MQPSQRNFRSIQEIPLPYQNVFRKYPCFNIVQSTVLDEAVKTDNSLVVSAPTGSGKTAIFEMAIIRNLMLGDKSPNALDNKIIYISPIKALCKERLIDWHKKFSDFGIKCISATSDTDDIDTRNISEYNLIISTPEKWDVMTRRWRENTKLIGAITLFLIDEVHLLNADSRGPTLEVIVSRMKTAVAALTPNQEQTRIRFIALSATIPNIEDIAEWIGASGTVKQFKFSEEVRPVKLNKIVIGYNFNPQNQSFFKFDMSLSYKLSGLISNYSQGKPTLVFCNTRKSVEMTSSHLVSNLQIRLSPEQKEILINISQQLSDSKLKQYIVHGIAFHHAGLIQDNRYTIEESFRTGHLPVLVTTSTLAMGVNLPAHLVIVKCTKCYSDNGYKDYDEVSIFQMIGRAGRNQFDSSATALILTSTQDKAKYDRMLGCTQIIESNLHKHLTEHLNAEVVLKTITDLEVAMRWLSSTFLYVRARRSPEKYKLPAGLSKERIDKKLLEMCQIDLNKLVGAGMIKMNQAIEIAPTVVGEIMAKYYVAFDTMKLFTQIAGTEVLIQILAIISKCKEFSEIYLRNNDKKCLNMLNKSPHKESNRFPLTGRIKTVDMKINVIIQSVLGNLEVQDQSIICDSIKVMRSCERLAKCLIEYLETREKCYSALLNTIILTKCFRVKLWENSPYVSKQLTGVGQVISTSLMKAGKTSFKEIVSTNPRHIEMIVGRKAPFGNTIVEEATHLPQYSITLTMQDKKVELVINLLNPSEIEEKPTISLDSVMTLLVGDSGNNILLYEKYAHAYMLENPEVRRSIDIENENLDFVNADFISENWVGIDCSCKLELSDTLPVHNAPKNKNCKQTFMDIYMNHVKKAYTYNKKADNKSTSKESVNSTGKKACTKGTIKKQPSTNTILEKNNGPKECMVEQGKEITQIDVLEKKNENDDKPLKLAPYFNEEKYLSSTTESHNIKSSENPNKKPKTCKKNNIIISKSIFRTASTFKNDKKKHRISKSQKVTGKDNFRSNSQAKAKMDELQEQNNVTEGEDDENTTDYSSFEKKYDKTLNKTKNKKKLIDSSKSSAVKHCRTPSMPTIQIKTDPEKIYTDNKNTFNHKKQTQSEDAKYLVNGEESYQEGELYNLKNDELKTSTKNNGSEFFKTSEYENTADFVSSKTINFAPQNIFNQSSHKIDEDFKISNNNLEARDNMIIYGDTQRASNNKLIFDEKGFNNSTLDMLEAKYKLSRNASNAAGHFDGEYQNQGEGMKKSMDNPDSTVEHSAFQRDFCSPHPKRQKNDDNYASPFEAFPQKSIKWRSPLVHSPAGKFSPHMKVFGFNFGEKGTKNHKEDIGESNDLQLGTQDTSTSSMNLTSFEILDKRPNVSMTSSDKSRKKKPKYQFPLSDQDYVEQRNESVNKKGRELTDLCDLGDFGLANKQKESILNSSASSKSSAGKYYSQLMNSQRKTDGNSFRMDENSQLTNVTSTTPYPHSKLATPEAIQQSQDTFFQSSFLPSSKEFQFPKPCQRVESIPSVPNENNINNHVHINQPMPMEYYNNNTHGNFSRRHGFDNITTLPHNVSVSAIPDFDNCSNAGYTRPQNAMEHLPQRCLFNPFLEKHRYPERQSSYFTQHQQPVCERPLEMLPRFSVPTAYPCLCCGHRYPNVNPYTNPYLNHVNTRHPPTAGQAYRSRISDIPEEYIDYCLRQMDDQPSHFMSNSVPCRPNEFNYAGNFVRNVPSPDVGIANRSGFNFEVPQVGIQYDKENITSQHLGPNPTYYKFGDASSFAPTLEATAKAQESQQRSSENQFEEMQMSRENMSQFFAPTPKRQLAHSSKDFNSTQNQTNMNPQNSLPASSQNRLLNFSSFEKRMNSIIEPRSQGFSCSAARNQKFDQPGNYNTNSYPNDGRQFVMNRFMFPENQNPT